MSIVYVNTIAPNTGDTVSVSGSLFVSGNINLGDANTDGINFNADVDSHIIPNSASIYNLGSSSKGWNNVYANNFYGTASLATAVSGTSIVGTTGSFGTLSASLVYGLLATQAQTNITSLGTLSGLNVYGPLSASDGHGLYVSHNINAGGEIQANKITTTGSSGLAVANSASIGYLTVTGSISSSGTATLGNILLPYQGKIFVEDNSGNTNDVFFHNLADGGLFVGDSDTKLVLTASNDAGGVTTSTGTKFTTFYDVRLGNSSSYHNIDIVGNLHLNNNSIDEITHITASGGISSSGDVSANSLTLRFTEGASQDLASSAFYVVNGSKVKVKAITAANINDGAFAEFSLVNTSIQDDSVIMCNFAAGCANNISSSILTAAVSKSGAARVFIHNETGATINADTAFTASFVIL